ncbi:MAG TPA: phytoene/squalene synthase family protein [Ignavibacteria bacterium]|nr:phytoene/squalene synthase family protein [Ignavibacteria bacterium]
MSTSGKGFKTEINFENKNEFDEKVITKNSKSNFLYSFSLLSKEKNDAINTVYAFCRKTDDIVDNEEESKEDKFTRLQDWKSELANAIESGQSDNLLLGNVEKVIRTFKIPTKPFFELIEGMEMDLKKSRYNNLNELYEYCFKVASTVGLMSIEIFGYNNPMTREFAINLGIALQLTNIIRDIKTDADGGRIYIPMEDLRKFNYTESDLLEGRYNEKFINMMKYECERAKYFYEEADKSLQNEDKGNMFPAKIMESIYFRLLKKIEANNYNVFEKKIRVSNIVKLMITAGIYLKYKLLYGSNENVQA